MRAILTVVALLSLAGCVSMAKVERGDRAIAERLNVKIESAWNHVNLPGSGPAETWTMEGLPVDQLLLYSGVKDGELIHGKSQNAKARDFAFRAAMQPHEIVSMFEGMLTRDGSTFTLVKLEPAPFGGLKGFRFEYTLTRKSNNVVLSGLGWGGVSRNELFAILYMAPRMTFFVRHAAGVEKMAMSARVRE